MNDSHTKSRYFYAVDGLRLLASVNIVLFHIEGIGGFYDLNGMPEWFFRIVKGPAFSASIFFILGGFIFTSKFASNVESFNTWHFLKKRFSELYPLHVLTTLFMIGLMLFRYLPEGTLSIPKLIYSSFLHLSLLYSFFPFFSYSLNTPSWALSAFFFCYLLFHPLLRFVSRINNKSTVILWIVIFLIPNIIWGIFFNLLDFSADLYQFFHAFAPIRFFDFGIGALMARFFQISDINRKKTLFTLVIYDVVIIAASLLIYFNLQFFDNPNKPFMTWMSYHLFMIPLYVLILYCLAVERGLIQFVLSRPFIRNIGKSSFYPYLIHIPLVSGITFICEKYFGYSTLLHSPVNATVLTLFIYVSCFLYFRTFRKKKIRKSPSSDQKSVPVNVNA